MKKLILILFALSTFTQVMAQGSTRFGLSLSYMVEPRWEDVAQLHYYNSEYPNLNMKHGIEAGLLLQRIITPRYSIITGVSVQHRVFDHKRLGDSKLVGEYSKKSAALNSLSFPIRIACKLWTSEQTKTSISLLAGTSFDVMLNRDRVFSNSFKPYFPFEVDRVLKVDIFRNIASLNIGMMAEKNFKKNSIQYGISYNHVLGDNLKIYASRYVNTGTAVVISENYVHTSRVNTMKIEARYFFD